MDEARQRVQAAGLLFRTSGPPQYAVTADYRHGRVTVRLDENDVVLRASQEFRRSGVGYAVDDDHA